MAGQQPRKEALANQLGALEELRPLPTAPAGRSARLRGRLAAGRLAP